MIHPSGTLTPISPRYELSFVRNDRMAGSIPKWHKQTDALETTQNLQPSNIINKTPVKHGKAFGFDDLLDMLNPLQHIPVVNHLYRKSTGDEIKPIGQIIGGAVYGGAAGASAGLVSVIAQNEWGSRADTQTTFKRTKTRQNNYAQMQTQVRPDRASPIAGRSSYND